MAEEVKKDAAPVKPPPKAPRKQGKPTQGASGFTATLRKYASQIVIHRVPEVTRYLLNMVALANVAMSFEHDMRYERPPPAGFEPTCLFASYFMWVLLTKVYLVGRRTNQLRGFGDNFAPEGSDWPLPSVLATMVDGIGEFEDTQTKIKLVPRVTTELLTYISNLSEHFARLPYLPENDPNAFDAYTLKGYMQYCYGDAVQLSVVWHAYGLVSGAEVPFNRGFEDDHVRAVTAREVAAQAGAPNDANAVNLTVGQLRQDLLTPLFLYDIANNRVPPVPQANAHPYLTAARRLAVVNVQENWVAPRVIGNAAYGAGNNMGAAPFSSLLAMQIGSWLKKNFVTKSLSGSISGSVSSVVVYSRRGVGCALTSVCPATPEEMLFGAMFGARHVIFVTGTDRVMNLNDSQRSTPPFSTQDLDTTHSKLLTAALLETRLY